MINGRSEMCNCMTDTEARLVEHFKAQLPADATGIKASLGGYGLILGKNFTSKHYLEAVI